jgi:preprotein translocase subunit SecA
MIQSLFDVLTSIYEDKTSHVSNEQRMEIEKILYLQIVDNAWREHLYSMDTLKTGIGLRGYNQKDPLVEYKKESYNMFMELIETIKNEIIKVLFTIKLRNEEEEQKEMEALKSKMEESNKDLQTNIEESQIDAKEKKIARNDPCPCGSGKKYKNCHGKSGPKRGLVAQ